MARRPSRRPIQRSLGEWALRGGLAAAALAIGYASTAQTLAFAIGKSATERGHRLSPGDGRIAGELAEQLSGGEAEAKQRARADRIARQALIDEPLAAPAFTALALNAQLRSDTARARQLFGHSDALSRRELGTRLWLIEDAVEQGDIPGALRHYDIALRTSSVAPEILFPVLSNAIADPVVASALSKLLVTRPLWTDAFINYLPDSGAEPNNSATLFLHLARQGVPVSASAQAHIVNKLVSAGAINDAWTYYRTLRLRVDRRLSRDPDFSAQLQAPSVFDWVPMMNDAGVTASIQQTRDGGVFDFAAPSTIGSIVLQQLQFLPPGRYNLDGTSANIQQAHDARPYWQLSCIDGQELGRIEVPNSSENNGRFFGTLMVAEGCTAQVLRLTLRPSPAIGGVTGQIKHVMLSPSIKARR